MKASTIAIVGLGLAGAAALAKRSKTAIDRIGPPTQIPTPTEPDAPTIAMMRAPTPPSPVQGSWSRLVAYKHSAQRSKLCNPNTGNCFSVPPTILFGGQPLDLSQGRWVSVRLWAETLWSPVRKENRPAASYWAWSGEIKRSAALPSIVRNVAITGSDLPAASWLQAGARISVDNVLQISWRYPGNEHTGIERGRDYDIVLEWRITPNKPQ